MRGISLVLAVLVPFMACTSTNGAERRPVPAEHQRWTAFDPGGGGGYRCVAFSPHERKMVIAGDVSGVYVSDDYESFRVRNRGLINHYVHCVLFHPANKDIVFVGTRGGVARSPDGGETWQMKRNGFRPILAAGRSSVYAMAIDSVNPNIVYAGMGVFGDFGSSFRSVDVMGYVYKSTDCGETWQEIEVDGGALTDQSIMCLAVDPANHSKLYLVGQYRFYISTDAGLSWTQRPLPYADCKYTSVAVKTDDPNVLVLSYAQKGADKLETGLLRSADNGASWTNVLTETVGSTKNGILNVRTHPSEPGTFYACFHKNQKGVYRSTDAGLTWAKFNDTEEQNFTGWLSWRTKASDIAIDPKNPNIMCYIANGPGTAYLTEDGGRIWKQISCCPSPEGDGSYYSSGLTILCATDLVINAHDPRQLLLGYKDQTVFKTVNGGRSIFKGADPMYVPSGNVELLEADPADSNIVYMARGMLPSTQYLHRSTDFGETFELIGDDTGLTGHYITDIAIDPQSPVANRTLYVATQDGGVFKSGDNGASWTASVAGLPADSRKLTAVAVDRTNRNNIYVSAQCSGTAGGYVAKSTDGGVTWRVVLGVDDQGATHFSSVDIRCMAIDPFDANVIYAGNRDNQGHGVNKIFWKSTDGGTTWTSVAGDVFNVGLFQRDPPRKYYPQCMTVDPTLPGRLYFGFNAGGGDYGWDGELFYSDDRGATWKTFDNTDLHHFKFWRIVVDPIDPTRLYVATAGNGVLRYGAPPASRTHLFFSTSGDDADPGTMGEPKRSLEHAVELMGPGTSIHLKRGDAWYLGTGTWQVTNVAGAAEAPIEVSAYGSGPPPVVAAMDCFEDGWTDEGGKLWSHPISGYSGVKRCFVDGEGRTRVSFYDLDDPKEYATSGGTKVVLYGAADPGAGSTVEVVPHVDGLHTLHVENVSHLTFRNIEFRGGRLYGVQAVAPTAHLRFEECGMRRLGQGGITFGDSADTSAVHANPAIEYCVVDKDWTLHENPENAEPGGDLITFLNAVESGIIRNTRVVDSGHTSINLKGFKADCHGVNNCIVERTEVTLETSHYGRALAVRGLEGKCTGNIVRRNNFHDVRQPSKLWGQENVYYGNLFVYHRAGAAPKANGNTVNLGGALGEETCRDNVIAHNTFYDTGAHTIDVAGLTLGRNRIVNNLLLRFGQDPGGYGVRIQASVALQGIEHNGFWKNDVVESVMRIHDVSYTAEAANAQLGDVVGNIQAAPSFVDEAGRDFRLTPDSPYVSAGIPLADMGEGFTDYDGNPWHPSAPSVGAFQYVSGTDADGDGLDDHIDPDDDNDTMPDEWETDNGLDPVDASDAARDADGDGSQNLSEYVAGTNPNDAKSVLKVTEIAKADPGVVVRFDSVEGRLYTVEYADDPAGGAWTVLRGDIAGTGGAMEVADPAHVGRRMYRVKARIR